MPISLEPVAVVRSPRTDLEDDNWGKVVSTIELAEGFDAVAFDGIEGRRPNRLGATIVKLEQREGRVLTVRGLDAVDGTPVLDIKPVMREFLPPDEIRQPTWSRELMRQYWFT